MDFEEYPLLHTAGLMHTLLKAAAAAGGADLDDVAARVRADLRLAGEDPPVSEAELIEHLARVRTYLEAARVIESDSADRFAVTERGRDVLAAHPHGVDTSVLMAFPEFRAFVHRRAGGPPRQANPTIYDSGHSAYRGGAGPADNPYPFDTAEHLAWENGWFEARDEDSDHQIVRS